jgi:hypothetical protein
MADVLFLDAHPGWTYPAMLATPDTIMEGLRMLAIEKAKAAKRDA